MSDSTAYPISKWTDWQSEALAQFGDAIIAIDLQRRIIYWNRAAERLYGLAAKEALGLILDEAIQYRWIRSSDEVECRTAMADVGYWRGELIHRTQAGTEIVVELAISPIKSAEGEVVGYLGINHDVSERFRLAGAIPLAGSDASRPVADALCEPADPNERLRRGVRSNLHLEQTLKAVDAKWRSLVENSPDLVYVTDLDGRLTFFNRVVQGYDPALVLGTTVFEYVDVEQRERLRAFYQQVRSTREIICFEMPGPGGVGEAWYRTRLGPIIVDGNLIGMILVTTDISDRKRAEDALHTEQRFLTQLLKQQEFERRLIAYEIHDGLVQYITGALMRLEGMLVTTTLPEEQLDSNFEPALQLLRHTIDDARRLISGLRPPILDESGIVPAIEYLIEELTAGKQISVEFTREITSERFVPVVESTLFRICQESLSNALRHSRATSIQVRLAERVQDVSLEITDAGVGFNPAKIVRGFGLQGIRLRAHLMGGEAKIISEPGNGTRIVVQLPLAPEF